MKQFRNLIKSDTLIQLAAVFVITVPIAVFWFGYPQPFLIGVFITVWVLVGVQVCRDLALAPQPLKVLIWPLTAVRQDKLDIALRYARPVILGAVALLVLLGSAGAPALPESLALAAAYEMLIPLGLGVISLLFIVECVVQSLIQAMVHLFTRVIAFALFAALVRTNATTLEELVEALISEPKTAVSLALGVLGPTPDKVYFSLTSVLLKDQGF